MTPPMPVRETSPRRFGSIAAATGKLLLCLASAWIAGCTMGPDYKRPEVPVMPAWRASVDNAAELANTEWWKAFGDADLDKLIEDALDANKDLQLATFRIEEFDARLQVSRAPNYPTVGANSAVGREHRSQERPNGLQPGASPNLSNLEGGGNISWELDLWGRVKRSNEAALAELLSMQEVRRGVMLSVVASVATSYVQLLELDARLESAKLSLKNREDLLALYELRYKGGSGTLLSVQQARSEVETDATEIPPIERDIASLENALSGLIGRKAGPIARRKLGALTIPQMPQGVPADILSRRPDVMAAEQDLVAANARIGVAKTAYYPTLSLTAAFGLGADDPRWLLAKTARTGSIGASVVGTLFDGGRIEGDIRAAEAVQRQKVVLFQQAVQSALREVEDALVWRSKSGEREALIARLVGTLKEVSRLARLRYEGGQTTFKDVLDADRQLLSVQSKQAQNQKETMLALISVYRAMGGGWMVEVEKRKAQATPVGDVQAQAAIQQEALEK